MCEKRFESQYSDEPVVPIDYEGFGKGFNVQVDHEFQSMDLEDAIARGGLCPVGFTAIHAIEILTRERVERDSAAQVA